MPLKIFTYVKGLLAVSEAATCTAMSRVVVASHDSLTRILQDTKLEWQILLSSFIRKILGKLSDGYVMIDDTVINKSFAKVIGGLAWVFCSKEGRSVLGLNIVVLAWSNGTITHCQKRQEVFYYQQSNRFQTGAADQLPHPLEN